MRNLSPIRRPAAALACLCLGAGATQAHWPPLGARQGCSQARLLSQGVVVAGGPGDPSGDPQCVLGLLDLVEIMSKLVLNRPVATPHAAGGTDFATAATLTPYVWEDLIHGAGTFGFWGDAMAWNTPSPGYQLLLTSWYEEAFFCDIASTMYFEPVVAPPGAVARVSIRTLSGVEIGAREFAMDAPGAHLSIASPGQYQFKIELEWRTPELPMGDSITAVPLSQVFAHLEAGAACAADLNVDQVVEDTDFVLFASAYNLLDCSDPLMPLGCPADLSGDGIVEDADFVIFAAAYDALECD